MFITRAFLASIVVTLAASAQYLGEPTTQPAVGTGWSEPSNGLRGRLVMRRSHVTNGTPIIATYLELQNVRNLANPMVLKQWPLTFKMTDADGRALPQAGGAFSGLIATVPPLILPLDSTLKFRIGPKGWGIPGDMGALVDLGPGDGWALPRDGKPYFLSATLALAEDKAPRSDHSVPWHGKIELPPVRVPTEPDLFDPATLGRRIEELGAQLLSDQSDRFEEAQRSLSLIDDLRVIPWYVKAVKTDSYERKFAAIDRLSRFSGDEAFAGLKVAATTQGTDIGHCTSSKVAAESAENIRVSAAYGLARSPHPQAKPLLWTMDKDPAQGVRLVVIQAAARDISSESLELIKRATNDPDELVRGEANRLLSERQRGK